jgi:hypothetical protein
MFMGGRGYELGNFQQFNHDCSSQRMSDKSFDWEQKFSYFPKSPFLEIREQDAPINKCLKSQLNSFQTPSNSAEVKIAELSQLSLLVVLIVVLIPHFLKFAKIELLADSSQPDGVLFLGL